MDRHFRYQCLIISASAACVFLAYQTVLGDVVNYTANQAAYPVLTTVIQGEYNTTSFPPLNETSQTSYRVNGTGATTIRTRFKFDNGSFLFSFGFYKITQELNAIDVTTDSGKVAYANAALAAANSTLVYDDRLNNPGTSSTSFSVTGGDTLGFFLIPDSTVANYRTNPATFAVNGTKSDSLDLPGNGFLRFPLFSVTDANPGNRDQLMSFDGTSTVTGQQTSMFGWEDRTRATIAGNPRTSDNNFTDLIFTIEGVQSIPEPAISIYLLGSSAVLLRRRKQ